MRKSIVFIIRNLHGGGAERVLSNLANFMYNDGYNVTIIVHRYDENQYPVESGVNVCYINTSSHICFLLKTRRIIKKINPENVIAFEYFYNMLACISCLGLKTKLVISERNDPAIVGAGIFKTPLRNFLYRFCDKLVCQTSDAKNFFPKYIQEKTSVILNPLRIGLPKPYTGLRENKIVNFCRLNKQKNIPLLIDAFNIFRQTHEDYQLYIFGQGESEQEIIEYISSLNLEECVFLRPFSNSIHTDILRFKMFVSSSDYEGLSNSMLEAIAIGLPTISTDCPCGGARMVIDSGKNGIITPVNNAVALAEAMAYIADNDIEATKISIAGATLRDTLSLENIGNQWKQILI